MVQRVLNTEKNSYGYRYADSEVGVFENKLFKPTSLLLPYQYSFGIIYARNAVASFGNNTKKSNLIYDRDVGYIDYAEVPTVEEFRQIRGYTNGFAWVEGISSMIPKILSSSDGLLNIGYDIPMFVNNTPTYTFPTYSGRLSGGNILCLIGIDAMVFNPG